MTKTLKTLLIILGVVVAGGLIALGFQELIPEKEIPANESKKEDEGLRESDEWKAYINYKYGFEFKYPKIYDEDEEYYKLCSPKGEGNEDSVTVAQRIFINIVDLEGLSLEEYLGKIGEELLVEEQEINESRASMSYRIPGSMAQGVSSWQKNNTRDDGKIYQIAMERTTDICDYEDKTIFDVYNKIISTFRFLD